MGSLLENLQLGFYPVRFAFVFLLRDIPKGLNPHFSIARVKSGASNCAFKALIETNWVFGGADIRRNKH